MNCIYDVGKQHVNNITAQLRSLWYTRIPHMDPTVFFWCMLQPSTALFCCDFFNPVEKSKESRQVHDHFCATFFWSKSRKLKKWPEISGRLVLEVSVPTPFKMSRDAQVIQVTCWKPRVGGHQHPLKGSLNHLKEGTKNGQDYQFFCGRKTPKQPPGMYKTFSNNGIFTITGERRISEPSITRWWKIIDPT